MSTQSQATQSQFHISDVMTLTARLAQVLAEEVDLLSTMQVSKIDALQQEKLFLVNALEAQKKLVQQKPDFSESIPSQDKKDLQELVDVFNNVLEENHRKLQLAKEVNQYVVKAITKVAKDNASSRYYSPVGAKEVSPQEVLSVTLNKMI